ncbi:MAG TPA: clostripain-related cysteine peptidase, partial [Allocoleopsis sp.]
NMGAQNSLVDFANWSMSNYRANNYAMVLWNHGGGYSGIAWDDTNNGDRLELSEVSGALGSLSSSISVLGTDACLMGMVEFAHQIRNNASVLVASEELIPGEGWNYTTLLTDLTGNSSMTANQLGTAMVNRYGQFYGSQGNNGIEETLSAINLVNLRNSNPNNLSATLSQFATTFMNNSTSNDRNRLSIHRNSASSFESNPNNRDLGTILSRVVNDTTMTSSIRTAAQTALNAYNSLIIQNYSSINQRATGMAIYFQARGSSVDSYYNRNNLSFANDTTGDEFLNWWRTA